MVAQVKQSLESNFGRYDRGRSAVASRSLEAKIVIQYARDSARQKRNVWHRRGRASGLDPKIGPVRASGPAHQ